MVAFSNTSTLDHRVVAGEDGGDVPVYTLTIIVSADSPTELISLAGAEIGAMSLFIESRRFITAQMTDEEMQRFVSRLEEVRTFKEGQGNDGGTARTE
jgi:hypothetical protein